MNYQQTIILVLLFWLLGWCGAGIRFYLKNNLTSAKTCLDWGFVGIIVLLCTDVLLQTFGSVGTSAFSIPVP